MHLYFWMATWLSQQQHDDLAIGASARQQHSPAVDHDHDHDHHHRHHHHRHHHHHHGDYDDKDDQKCPPTGWTSTLCLPEKFGTLK